MSLQAILVYVAALSTAIFIIAEIMPGVRVKNFGTAVLVAVVYGLLNYTLGWFFQLLTLPLVVITLGLFLIVINAFFLWMTDKLIDDFEIEGCGLTIFASFCISVTAIIFRELLRVIF